VLRDPLGDAEDVLYPDDPGSFCAPVFPDGMPVYCTPSESGESDVVSADPDGTRRQVLWSSRGLVSIVAAPHGGTRIAVSSAPRGEGTPYRGIDVVDLDGSTRRVTDADCMAYFWCPTGEAILYASVDTRENCITWHRVTLDGATRSIATFWPTRDTLFYLHFFDQYASSHPVISPDGRWLAFAGYPAGGGQADLSAPPRIYVKDLHDVERPAAEVGNGHFAVFPTSVTLVDGWQAPR
jgi:Tol biopolymer transport system component